MKRPLAVTAIVLAALLLAGCTAGSGGSASSTAEGGASGGAGVPAQIAPDGAPGKAADGSANGGFTGADSNTDVNAGNRDVVTTGQVSLNVEDPIASAQDAADITLRAGGRIDSRTENPAGGTGTSTGNPGGVPGPSENQAASASLTLRIPADKLDQALTALKKLGTVNSVSLNASDVTQQTQDLDARITALTTSVDRLLDLMTRATSTTDLIAIESALSDRQAQLESLQSQRDLLSDQIDYSTLTLELHSIGTLAPGSPDNFWTAITAGWKTLVAALGGLVVALGFALPWLVALAVVALLALLGVRLARRRKAAPSVEPVETP
jgi:hypothetical protein